MEVFVREVIARAGFERRGAVAEGGKGAEAEAGAGAGAGFLEV